MARKRHNRPDNSDIVRHSPLSEINLDCRTKLLCCMKECTDAICRINCIREHGDRPSELITTPQGELDAPSRIRPLDQEQLDRV